MTRLHEGSRRHAREVAFRVAYQADVTHDSYATTWASRGELERLSQDQRQLVDDVVRRLEECGEEVDQLLQRAAEHWSLSRLSATDRSVLRTAVAELMSRTGTPARVILEEAIEIAKRYGSDESGRFVNGVLDQVARHVRPGEF